MLIFRIEADNICDRFADDGYRHENAHCYQRPAQIEAAELIEIVKRLKEDEKHRRLCGEQCGDMYPLCYLLDISPVVSATIAHITAQIGTA